MPPKVVRQTIKKVAKKPIGRKPKGTSVLDRIQPVGEFKPGLRMVVYGRSKSGKTRLFSTFPKPALLIGTENGTISVSNVKGLDFVRVKASSEIDELIEICKEGKYKSVCLDHGSGLRDLILMEVLGLEDVPVQKDWGIAKRDDWGTVGAQLKERIRSLLLLAEMEGLDVMIIAHEHNFNEESSSDLIMPTVGAALGSSVMNWVNGAVDYVAQTFIREEIIKKTVKIGGKIKTTTRTGDKKEYCLRIGPHPVFMTGFRTVKAELPDVIVNASHAKIVDLIGL